MKIDIHAHFIDKPFYGELARMPDVSIRGHGHGHQELQQPYRA